MNPELIRNRLRRHRVVQQEPPDDAEAGSALGDSFGICSITSCACSSEISAPSAAASAPTSLDVARSPARQRDCAAWPHLASLGSPSPRFQIRILLTRVPKLPVRIAGPSSTPTGTTSTTPRTRPPVKSGWSSQEWLTTRSAVEAVPIGRLAQSDSHAEHAASFAALPRSESHQ
jgi:hypothetical protein